MGNHIMFRRFFMNSFKFIEERINITYPNDWN